MTQHLRHLPLAAVLLGLGCAHAPASPPLPAVTWPAPPAAPRLRLVAVWSAETLHPPRPSAWRRLAAAIVGEAIDEAGPDLLVRPFGVAASPGGAFLVADPDAQVVLRVGPDGGVERLACPDAAWAAPMAVALDERGDVLVADAGRGVVVVLGRAGGCRLLGAGELDRPTGLLALGRRVLVADPGRHALLALPLDGGPATAWGGEARPFRAPIALASAADGSVLVVDALAFEVARLDAEGRRLGELTVPPEAGGLFRPKGVVADGAGRIYVSDAERDLVHAFAADGAYEAALGAPGPGPGELAGPAGLALADDRLLVADSLNRRVQVFEILGGRT